MPGLSTSLRAFDPDQLEQIANYWGVQLPDETKESMRLSLELEMLDPMRFQVLFETLPEIAQRALLELRANQGQMSWSAFSFRYGEIPAMGPAKRKKEQPWAFPSSTSELLWYRGLIGRDFLRQGDDLEEKAYLPDEILAMLPESAPTASPLAALQAQRLNLPEPIQDDRILNDLCTLLAALRFDQPKEYLTKTHQDAANWLLLRSLFTAIGVIEPNGEPSDLARSLLEMSRGQALIWVWERWETARGFNEFDFIPNLQIQTAEPILTSGARKVLMDILRAQPPNQWYKLEELVQLIKERFPDFLRAQEQFFSWNVVLSKQPDQPLLGLDSWEHVEGSWIRFVARTMLPLLGLSQAHQPTETSDSTFFHLTPVKSQSFSETQDKEKSDDIKLNSTGKITMTDRSPLMARYQISRFCEWLALTENALSYQLTPRSLSLAQKQGLLPKHLLALLRKYVRDGLPPQLFEAIKRWEAEGEQARIEALVVLRLANAEMLQALRATPASRWLGEALGPTAITIKPGGQEPIRSALAGLGYLSDSSLSEANDA